MAGRLTITAFAGSKKGANVPIYVSASNDLGLGMTGYTKKHFNLELLHSPLKPDMQKLFKLKVDSVEDLDKGYYKILCSNAQGGEFPSGRIVLSLRIQKFTGGLGSDSGQTLVSLDME